MVHRWKLISQSRLKEPINNIPRSENEKVKSRGGFNAHNFLIFCNLET